MKRVTTLKELQSELTKTHSGCAGDTIFIAKAMMFAVEQNERLIKQVNARIDSLDRRVNSLLIAQIRNLKGEQNAGKRIRQGNESQRRVAGDSEGKEIVSKESNAGIVEAHQEAQTKSTA